MNCIDAIEGAAKSVIAELFQLFSEDRLDDTEYIRNIKAVITGMDAFTNENKEIVSDPQMLIQVLYEFSKRLWLNSLETNRNSGSGQQDGSTDKADDGYDDYYFDYIYKHGEYPR